MVIYGYMGSLLDSILYSQTVAQNLDNVKFYFSSILHFSFPADEWTCEL